MIAVLGITKGIGFGYIGSTGVEHGRVTIMVHPVDVPNANRLNGTNTVSAFVKDCQFRTN